MKRLYRLVIERQLVVELESDLPEEQARQRAALAMIEDLARHPFGAGDVAVDAIPDPAAAGQEAPDLRLR